MFDKKPIIAALALKATDGDIEAAKTVLELQEAETYEELLNGMDDDELATETDTDQLQLN